MEPYILALIIAVGVLAIVALVLIIVRWRAGSLDTKAVITQLYAIGATILKSLKNDGKISADELENILTEVKALIAVLQGSNLEEVEGLDAKKSNTVEVDNSQLFEVSANTAQTTEQ